MGVTDPKVESVVDLVHKRDALQAERKRMTAEIDRQLAECDAAILALTSTATATRVRKPRPLSANGAGATYTEKLLTALRGSARGVDYVALTIVAYGKDTRANRKRTSALLHHMAKRGTVEQVKVGEETVWKFVKEAAG